MIFLKNVYFNVPENYRYVYFTIHRTDMQKFYAEEGGRPWRHVPAAGPVSAVLIAAVRILADGLLSYGKMNHKVKMLTRNGEIEPRI